MAFDLYPNAPKVKIDWSPEVPELPVVPSTVADLEAKITGIVAKLDKLPLEAIGADLTKALASLSQTLEDASKAVNRIDSDVTPGLKSTLDGLRGTISAVDRTLNSADATLVGKDAPAQQDLRDALQEIARAARSLRVLTDFLERHPECVDPRQDRGESLDKKEGSREECRVKMPSAESKELRDLMLRFSSPLHSTPDTLSPSILVSS